jgi:hypothetical protein
VIHEAARAMIESLSMFVPWFTSNGFFLVFWIFTLVAVVTPRRQVKNAYLVFFFSSMLSVGLVIGAPVWPFHDWHLWARMLPRTVNYQEVWLEDSTGRQIVYDLRAVPPLNPAYLNKLIAPRIKMLGEQGEKNPMAEWLMKKANSYQPPAPWTEWIRFPEREYSHYQCAGLYENSQFFPEWPRTHPAFDRIIIKTKRAVFVDGTGCGGNFTTLSELRVP